MSNPLDDKKAAEIMEHGTSREVARLLVDTVEGAALASSEEVTELSFESAVKQLGSFDDGARPIDICDAVFAQPFSLEVKQDIPAVIQAGKRGGTQIELPKGVGVMNKVRPEQLLAIIATLIATAPNATVACVRIRAEVEGWRFQAVDGEIK